jgi:putative transcriptional regulator
VSKSAFDKIAAGMEAAIDYVDGDREGFVTHIPEEIDLKGIRTSLGLSQPKFAEAFGFTVGRIRDWEQKRFAIDAPSRVLLTVIKNEPAAVLRALGRERDHAVTLRPTDAATAKTRTGGRKARPDVSTKASHAGKGG